MHCVRSKPRLRLAVRRASTFSTVSTVGAAPAGMNCFQPGPVSSVPVIFKTASQSVLKSQSSFTAAPTVAISPKLAINAVKSPTQSAPEFTA
eukprot:Skav200343  [mRNA]  locus=scaffold26:102515:102790:+ [translate_table: standard]